MCDPRVEGPFDESSDAVGLGHYRDVGESGESQSLRMSKSFGTRHGLEYGLWLTWLEYVSKVDLFNGDDERNRNTDPSSPGIIL
jgi:hypothetical protein